MALGFDFNDFPKLVINPDDTYGSWKAWLDEFELSVEMVTFKLGKETVNRRKQDVFKGRMKLLALLHAIGQGGRDVLECFGFDMRSEASSYEQAMAHLKNVYGFEETVYVKTFKFVTANQAVGENEIDYLLRVEKLGRSLNFENNDNVRQEFALAIAVNGLRESSLRLQLMQQGNLNWKGLIGTLEGEKISSRFRKHHGAG